MNFGNPLHFQIQTERSNHTPRPAGGSAPAGGRGSIANYCVYQVYEITSSR
jgi:hypothetical protein